MAIKQGKTFSVRLGTLIAFSLALMIIVSISLIGTIQAYRIFKIQKRAVLDQLALTAGAAAHIVGDFLMSTGFDLSIAVQLNHENLTSSLESERMQMMARLMRSFSAIRQLTLTNATGFEINKSSRFAIVGADDLGTLADTELWKTIQGGKRYLGQVQFESRTGEPLVSMALPILNLYGDTYGGLVAEIDLTSIWELVASLAVGQQGVSYVVDGNGRILAHSDMTQIDPGALLEKQGLSQLLNSKGNWRGFVADDHGNRSMAAAATIADTGWHFIAELPLEEAQREAFKDLWGSVMFMAATLIISVLVGIVLARRLSKPMKHLEDVAGMVAQGNFEPRIQAEQSGFIRIEEAQHLMAVFNEMLDQIESRNRELSQSQQLLHNVFETLEQGIFVLDRDFKQTYRNRGMEKISNAPNDGVLGTVLWERFPALMGSGGEDFARRAMDGEVISKQEIKHSWIGKKDSWVLRSFYPLKESDGHISGVLGVIEDVTERKEAEEELRESEEKFRLYMENAHDGVLIVGSDFRFEFVNAELCNLLGYPLEEIVGQRYTDFLDEESVRLVSERYRLRQDGVDVPPRYEFRIVRKSGEKRNVEISVGIIKDSKGEVKTIGSLLDITDRKLAEKEAHHLRNLLSNIINSMPSVLVGVDSEGKVTQWNKTAERATGVNAALAQGQPLADVFPRMRTEIEKIKQSIHTKEILQDQRRAFASDDGTGFEDVTIYPLISNGVSGAVIRIDDVTEKVRMQEMMIQSEKMLSVGGLAAGMAHEINNPLAGIMQTAGVMANRLGQNFDIPANRKAAQDAGTTLDAINAFMEVRGIPRMIATINESGKRVAGIVANMLSFARKSDARRSTQAIEELIDKTLELAATDYDLKKQYDFKLIEITKAYAQGLPGVPCEAAKIQQVLLNILRNGAQAMQETKTQSPQFIIRTYFLKARAMVCIEIEDNGPGMDGATGKRVFEPFYTTKPTGVGTGLGLSVSYFIITENHGGEMAVESSPGCGAKFIIRLPLEGKLEA